MSEKPLNEYIDLEAYDVVTGEQYRALKKQFDVLKRNMRTIRLLALDLKDRHTGFVHVERIAKGALDRASSPANVLADSYPPLEDVERAGELARERGWKNIGGQGAVEDPASRPK